MTSTNTPEGWHDYSSCEGVAELVLLEFLRVSDPQLQPSPRDTIMEFLRVSDPQSRPSPRDTIIL